MSIIDIGSITGGGGWGPVLGMYSFRQDRTVQGRLTFTSWGHGDYHVVLERSSMTKQLEIEGDIIAARVIG